MDNYEVLLENEPVTEEESKDWVNEYGEVFYEDTYEDDDIVI